MSLAETLMMLSAQLDRAGIAYMIAGSIASTHYGEPRSTQDIDLVIWASVEQVTTFVNCFDPSRYYLNEHIAEGKLRDHFNLIDTLTGWKVDLMLRKDRPFSRSEFERRQPVTILGVATFVATAEDTILAKLEWGKEGGSQRQFGDVVAMMKVQKHLDHDYLNYWAIELGIVDELARAFDAASGAT